MGAEIAAAISAGTQLIGMLGQKRRERRTMRNQQKLMGIQKDNQMELNVQGHNLQKKMWEETNYPAQMAMLKEAGLNPALMYGQGGGGGTTAGSQSGGSAQGGNAPSPQPMELGNLLMGAQMELIKAQADKNRAEAENLRGVERELKGTQIDSLTQGIKNQEATRLLTEVQTNLNKVDLWVKEFTMGNSIDSIIAESEKSMAQAKSLNVIAGIDEATKSEKINIINQTSLQAVTNTMLMNLGVKKTIEEIKLVTENVTNAIVNRVINKREINLKEEIGFWEIEFKRMANALGIDNLEQRSTEMYVNVLKGLFDVK